MKLFLKAGLGLAAALLAAVANAAATAADEVYVWQRQWDPALRAALAESRDFLGALRVLGLQRDGRGGWVEPAVDVAALAADGRPVTLVVRIDGSAPDWPAAELAARLKALLRRWDEAGVQAAVEIDHDCASARLPAYAEALADLRGALPQRRLSITALPAWSEAPALDALLAQADESVLQLHAVRSPAAGLFDADLAQAWVERWARRVPPPQRFRVALPAYGAHLKLDAGGGIAAVESEQVLPRRSAATRELRVDPRAVAAFLQTLRAQPPAAFAGVVWFRLPRADDRRAWALQTVRAVSLQQPLQAQVGVEQTAQAGGAIDLDLYNRGTLDAPPPRLRIAGDCSAGDGANGYRLQQQNGNRYLSTDADVPLRAGGRRRIGWLRCSSPPLLTLE